MSASLCNEKPGCGSTSSNHKSSCCGHCRVKVNLYTSQFDQESYFGRVMHFYKLYHPFHIFATEGRLENARQIMEKYRCGEPQDLSSTQLWKKKYLYDSAYDPQVDEKLPFFGRPAAYVPFTTLLLTGMLHNYYQIPHALLWQTGYQAFNVAGTVTNQRFCSPIPESNIISSFAISTLAAVATALLWRKKFLCKAPIFGRLGPMFAVAVGEVVNVPVRRYHELTDGIPIYDENGERLGSSTTAARHSILLSTARRLAIILPPLFLTPWYIEILDMRGMFCRYRWIVIPHHVLFVGMLLTFAAPFFRGMYKDVASIPFTSLPQNLQDCIVCKSEQNSHPERVYFRTSLHC